MGEIVIYPAGWVHNANVYGFLKVLSENGIDVHKMLRDDGTVIIDEDIQNIIYSKSNDGYPKLYEWWIMSSDKLLNRKEDPFEYVPRSLLSSNKTSYQNIVRNPRMKEIFINHVFKKPEIEEGEIECILCGNLIKIPSDNSIRRLHLFSADIFGEVSSSFGGFPNAFWNTNENFYICEVCMQLAFFRHFVFKNSFDFFINAPSFKAIWYLNQSVNAYKKIGWEKFGYSFVESSLKINRIIGAWEKQNIEFIEYIITRDKKFYNIYPLPPEVVDYLLDGEISHSLRIINNPIILKLVLYDDLQSIIDLSYKSLKAFITSNFDFLNSINFKDALRISYLPNLLISLLKIKRGVKALINPTNLKNLGNAVKNEFENSKFRLLELTRLGKKNEVYHFVLRTYMAKNIPFPEELSRVFKTNDLELFKSYMFAFISGMISGGGEK